MGYWSLSGVVSVVVGGSLTADEGQAALRGELDRLEPRSLREADGRIEFQGRILRSVSSLSLLAVVETGELTIAKNGGSLDVSYEIRLDAIVFSSLVLVALLALAVAEVAGPWWGLLALGPVGFGIHTVFLKVRFPQLLRRAILSARASK